MVRPARAKTQGCAGQAGGPEADAPPPRGRIGGAAPSHVGPPPERPRAVRASTPEKSADRLSGRRPIRIRGAFPGARRAWKESRMVAGLVLKDGLPAGKPLNMLTEPEAMVRPT